jgi:hypothetical protein
MEITMWLKNLHKPYSTIPAFCTIVSLMMPNGSCFLAAGPPLCLMEYLALSVAPIVMSYDLQDLISIKGLEVTSYCMLS